MIQQKGMTRISAGAVLAALAAVIGTAPAAGKTRAWVRPERPRQRAVGPTSSDAGERRIPLDFRDVDVGQVLDFLGIAAGKTVVKDPSLAGPVTVLSPGPVSVQQGLRILGAVLQHRGYTLEQTPLLIRVARGAANGGGSRPPGGAERVAGFREAGQSRVRLPADRQPQVMVLGLKAASAPQVAQIIDALFRPQPANRFSASTASRFRSGRSGRRSGRGGAPDPTLAALGGPVVRASADSYTNSVVVVAPPTIAGDIRRMVEQLDRKAPANVTTRVFRLQYGHAEELAPEVSSVLLGIAPAGAAGGPLQNVPWQQRVRLTARLGSLNATAGEVVPEARTNSLIISTTPENMAVVEKLLRQLDAPVHPRPTTIILPLQNARATDLGPVLNESFNPANRAYGAPPGSQRPLGSPLGQRPNSNPNRNLRGPAVR